LENFETEKLINERNAVSSAFLRSAADSDGDVSTKRNISVAMSLDCLYSARHPNTITPWCFASNLLTYFVSGSKTACTINSSTYPSGCYTTVLNWAKHQADVPIIVPGESDVITYFDNNQVLARNWRVRYDAKAMLGVVTSLIHIIPKDGTTLQHDPALSPSSWLYNRSSEEIVSAIETFSVTALQTFNAYRDDFISDLINITFKEQQQCDPVSSKNNNIVHKQAEDRYDFVSSHHPTETPNIITGETCYTNPCSYKAVKEVFGHISEQLHVGSTRAWTAVGCDGLPYVLGARLIEQEPELQNIFLQPGHGHYEMNMTRACFKVLWNVMLVDLGKMLGFRSIKALTACQRAYDHHKAWQMMQIVLFGTASELLVPYVQECIAQQLTPSVHGFYTWLSSVSDPNYLFLKDVVFTYIFALHLFRAGVRKNNSDVILAGRIKFSNLFFGVHMTTYQEIEYYDLKSRVLSPAPVNDFRRATESFAPSGNHSKGEGGDFVLESNNKRMKSWMPPGVPNEARWQRVTRNLDKLQKVN
jgi:hypothetical protein